MLKYPKTITDCDNAKNQKDNSNFRAPWKAIGTRVGPTTAGGAPKRPTILQKYAPTTPKDPPNLQNTPRNRYPPDERRPPLSRRPPPKTPNPPGPLETPGGMGNGGFRSKTKKNLPVHNNPFLPKTHPFPPQTSPPPSGSPGISGGAFGTDMVSSGPKHPLPFQNTSLPAQNTPFLPPRISPKKEEPPLQGRPPTSRGGLVAGGGSCGRRGGLVAGGGVLWQGGPTHHRRIQARKGR